MRKLYAWTLAFSAIANLFLLSPAALAARFVDMSGNWAERYVNILSDRGVIGAEPDGKFKPDEPVTRAILCAWLVGVTGADKKPVKGLFAFADVKKSDWFYKPVMQACESAYIAGYKEGFRPNQQIQKAEVITILVRALKFSPLSKEQANTLLAKYTDDTKIPDWARDGVAQATRADLVVNNPEPLVINPSSRCTRAACAALCFKLQEYLYKTSIDKSVEQAEAQAQAAPPAPPPASGGDYDGGGGGAGDAASPSGPGGDVPQAASPGSYSGGGSPGSGGGPPPSYQAAQPAGGPGGAPQYYAEVQKSSAPPGTFLQGTVTAVDAGTHFRATLVNTLNSGYNRAGEEFVATISEPVYSGGVEVLPVGSKLIGQITNVISAKNFNFGSPGKLDVKFTAVETPDGRRFPLVASVDAKQLKEAGGNPRGAVSNTMRKTGKGAAKGAKWGAIGGGIAGATTGRVRNVVKGSALGAIGGAVVGAGAGAATAGVQKGAEVNVPAGTILPIQLDQALQISGASQAPPVQSLQGGPPPAGYGGPPGGYAPPSGQYGAPPAGYGGPPGGYAPPPGQYGGPPPGGYAPVQAPPGYPQPPASWSQ